MGFGLGTIAAGVGAWNAFKNTRFGSGITNKLGNYFQKKLRSGSDDGWFLTGLKGVGNAANELVLNPTHSSFVSETAENKSDGLQNTSRNSSNATTSGADGSMYGEPSTQKRHYDYVNTDFENLYRKKQDPEVGRSHKYIPGRYTARTIKQIAADRANPGFWSKWWSKKPA